MSFSGECIAKMFNPNNFWDIECIFKLIYFRESCGGSGIRFTEEDLLNIFWADFTGINYLHVFPIMMHEKVAAVEAYLEPSQKNSFCQNFIVENWHGTDNWHLI